MLDLLDPSLLHPLLAVSELSDRPSPEPEDVKAGWVAMAIWLSMAVAVGLLGWSLVRQLRKAQASRDAGVYGDEPRSDGDPSDPSDLSGPRDAS